MREARCNETSTRTGAEGSDGPIGLSCVKVNRWLDASKNQLQTPSSPSPMPTLLWVKSEPLGPPSVLLDQQLPVIPFLCLRLSQVSGGCSEFRHVWPLQEDPHISGHGG